MILSSWGISFVGTRLSLRTCALKHVSIDLGLQGRINSRIACEVNNRMSVQCWRHDVGARSSRSPRRNLTPIKQQTQLKGPLTSSRMAEFLSRLSQSEVHLLPRAKVPNWQEASPFILSGYRPESRSWMRSMASWTYLHNESGNIFSHLLPGLALAVSAGIVGLDLRSLDGALVAFHLATATLCLSLSAIYHTGMNHSAPVAHLCLQIDYGGIMALVLGSFISGLHFAFRCEPALVSITRYFGRIYD